MSPGQGVKRQGLVSVVICSIEAGKFARVTANYSRLLAQQPFEIIGVHDARSLAEGYSRGIARSRGEILVLSHDDIRILTPDFAARLSTHLATYDLIGSAGRQKSSAAHGWTRGIRTCMH